MLQILLVWFIFFVLYSHQQLIHKQNNENLRKEKTAMYYTQPQAIAHLATIDTGEALMQLSE